MADVKVSALTALTGANLANGDQFLVTDVGSPNVSKSITADELAQGSQFSSRFTPLAASDVVFVGAASLAGTSGSPSLSGITGQVFAAWMLDSATEEWVSGQVFLPAYWVTYTMNVFWSNNGAGSGDVYWYRSIAASGNTDDLGSAGLSGNLGAVTAPAQNIVKKTPLATTSVGVGEPVSFAVARRGDLAGDTLGNDCAVLGVSFERAS